jgi:uncharacterized protein (DUF433 family)
MTNEDKALAIKELLVDMAVNDKLPMDMTMLDESIFIPILEEYKDDKSKTIESIQKIIKEWGSFTTADITADCDVAIPTNDNLIHLANDFQHDRAKVEIYEDGGQDEIDDYLLSYRDMELEQLQEILEYAERWVAECLQDEDRQS